MTDKTERPTTIYLAGPYTHKDPAVMHIRYEILTYIAACLTECGYNVYSPITHGHPMALKRELPRNFDYWMNQAYHHIDQADLFVACHLDGAQDSVGLHAETKYAFHKGIKVVDLYFDDVI